jgi:hypothetical protein
MCGTFEQASVLNQSCFPLFSHVIRPESLSMALEAAKKKPHQRLSHPFQIILTVTGMVYYDVVPEDLLRKQHLEEGVASIGLTREPTNQYDRNAIGVHLVVVESKKAEDSSKIGSVQKKHAALLAPWLDHELLRFESASIHHIQGPSTMNLQVKGWACDEATDMLATLS